MHQELKNTTTQNKLKQLQPRLDALPVNPEKGQYNKN